MNSMFKEATSFNRDITQWDTGESDGHGAHVWRRDLHSISPSTRGTRVKSRACSAMFQGTTRAFPEPRQLEHW